MQLYFEPYLRVILPKWPVEPIISIYLVKPYIPHEGGRVPEDQILIAACPDLNTFESTIERLKNELEQISNHISSCYPRAAARVSNEHIERRTETASQGYLCLKRTAQLEIKTKSLEGIIKITMCANCGNTKPVDPDDNWCKDCHKNYPVHPTLENYDDPHFRDQRRRRFAALRRTEKPTRLLAQSDTKIPFGREPMSPEWETA